jgi:hypothetical protein
MRASFVAGIGGRAGTVRLARVRTGSTGVDVRMSTVVMGVVGVRVAVSVRPVALGVRAGLGLERRLGPHDASAQARDHGLEDVVAADADPIRENLGRDVTVAEVPRDAAAQVEVAEDLRDRLGARDDPNDAAGFEREPVALAKRDRLGEVEQKHETLRAPHGDAPAVSAVVGQLDPIDLLLGPEGPTCSDRRRSDHLHLSSQPQKRK